MRIRTAVLMFLLAAASRVFGGSVAVVEFRGAINQSSAAYLTRCISDAEKMKAECVVLELDTPGGMNDSMRDIVQKILASKIPVVVHVAPKGARSASAGLFIAMAADYVAMAAGTNMGAAHPVYMDGKLASEKITNDAAAYIRSLAGKRGKNAAWAEEAVRKSVSVTETEALKLGISDAVADDTASLLVKLDCKKFKLLSGTEVSINTKNASVVRLKMNTGEELSNSLQNPTIAYILFLIGIYGLIYELFSPGTILAGAAGSICVVLASISFLTLSVSAAGIILLVLAVALFVLEIKATAHGALAAGGVVSLFLGSLMLFSPMMPYFKISMTVVITMVMISTAFFAIIITIGIKALKNRVVIGIKSLVGASGEVKLAIDPIGIVFVNKEDWTAEASDGKPVGKGEKIRVVRVEGIKLIVERTGESAKEQ